MHELQKTTREHQQHNRPGPRAKGRTFKTSLKISSFRKLNSTRTGASMPRVLRCAQPLHTTQPETQTHTRTLVKEVFLPWDSSRGPPGSELTRCWGRFCFRRDMIHGDSAGEGGISGLNGSRHVSAHFSVKHPSIQSSDVVQSPTVRGW